MKFSSIGVFLIATLLAIPFAAAQTKSDLRRDDWLGPVRAVRVELAEIATVDGKEVEVKRKPHQEVVYDRRGNEIERSNFNEDGSIANRAVQLIDEEGRVHGWQGYEANPNGKGEHLTGRSEFIYDEKGNRIEVRVYSDEALTLQNTAVYDAAGHVLEETRVTDGGTWKETQKHSYDAGGHLTRTQVDSNGTTQVIEQTYDDAGNRVSYKYSGRGGQGNQVAAYRFDSQHREIERSGEDAISKWKIVNSYDRKGRVIRRVTGFEYKRPNVILSHALEPGTVEFRYNDRDQVIEESAYSPEGVLQRKTINHYDDAGKLRSEAYHKGDGTVTARVTYEYDSWGNQVQRHLAEVGQNGQAVVHVEYHLITYYDGK